MITLITLVLLKVFHVKWEFVLPLLLAREPGSGFCKAPRDNLDYNIKVLSDSISKTQTERSSLCPGVSNQCFNLHEGADASLLSLDRQTDRHAVGVAKRGEQNSTGQISFKTTLILWSIWLKWFNTTYTQTDKYQTRCLSQAFIWLLGEFNQLQPLQLPEFTFGVMTQFWLGLVPAPPSPSKSISIDRYLMDIYSWRKANFLNCNT